MSIMPKKQLRDMKEEAKKLKVKNDYDIDKMYSQFENDINTFEDKLTLNHNLGNKIRRLMYEFVRQGKHDDEAWIWMAGFHLLCVKGITSVNKAPESKKLKEQHHARNRCSKLISKFSEDFQEEIES